MRNYIFIFITTEGYTYQPNSDSVEPDVENCQVVGFAKGKNEKEAFTNLIKGDEFLLDTTFNEIISIELKNDNYFDGSKYFYLNKNKHSPH
jgi:hypothetical protein